MAKAKEREKANKANSVPQRHLHSRISFLYQAATLLSDTMRSDRVVPVLSLEDDHRHHAIKSPKGKNFESPVPGGNAKNPNGAQPTQVAGESSQQDAAQRLSMTHAPMARQLLSQLRGVSLKSQIRLSPAIKHSVCKRCDTLLVPGPTSKRWIENPSKGGKKSWADVLVIQCDLCSTEKRFPVGARRQQRKEQRRKDLGTQLEVTDGGGE